LHQNSESLHLNLTGDFDGSSAHELLNTIKRYSRKTNRVFIHTNGLKEVHPFGEAVFKKDFPEIDRKPRGFIFTGDKLAP
jgi:hypothetical protein